MKTQSLIIGKYIVFFLLAPFFICSKCNKEDTLPEYYFRCKIDGQDYRPNSCANCAQSELLGDTTLLLGANRGFEALGIAYKNIHSITTGTYKLIKLSSPEGGGGMYKNSTTVQDIFRTDSTFNGELIITTLDKPNKIISGSFHFQAYNPVQDKTVNITDGKFRLKYTDY